MRNNRLVFIPIEALVKNSPRQLDAHGQTWERVISITRQPNTVQPKQKKPEA
jgi:6-phosphofructokinase 1